MEELLLSAWLRVSANLCNERLVKYMPYNEAFVCNLLYKKRLQSPEEPFLQVKDLCQATKMLKSQMNKTINALEEKGLVQRLRLPSNRRNVFVKINEEKMGIYEKEHDHILSFVRAVIADMGVDNAKTVLHSLNTISDSAEHLLKLQESINV